MNYSVLFFFYFFSKITSISHDRCFFSWRQIFGLRTSIHIKRKCWNNSYLTWNFWNGGRYQLQYHITSHDVDGIFILIYPCGLTYCHELNVTSLTKYLLFGCCPQPDFTLRSIMCSRFVFLFHRHSQYIFNSKRTHRLTTFNQQTYKRGVEKKKQHIFTIFSHRILKYN